ETLSQWINELGHSAVVCHDLPDVLRVSTSADVIIWAYEGQELEPLRARFDTAAIFLAVSAALTPRVVGEMMAQGVTDYLLRPYHLPELQRRLTYLQHELISKQQPRLPMDIQRLQTAIDANAHLGKANEALARVHELAEVLRAIVDHVREISPTADGAYVCFYNFATNRFEADKAAGWGVGHGQIHWPLTPPRPEGMLGRVLEEGMVTVLTAAERAQVSSAVRQQLDEAGIYAFIGLRLRAGPEPLGALFINYQGTYQLSGIDQEEEIGRLKLYADQAAFAMERAYLFERNHQERQLLQDVAKATRTGKGFEESAWEPVLEEAMEIAGAERGSIILRNELGYTQHIERGFSADYTATNSDLNHRIFDHIQRDNEIVFVQDLPRQLEWQHLEGTRSNARSILAVPIIDNQDGQLVGVISLKSSQPQAFDEADRELIISLAQRAEIAINAVYAVRQSLDEESQRLKVVYAAAKLINQVRQNSQTVLQTILDEARRITHSYFGTLQLLSEDKQFLEFIAVSPREHWSELMETIQHMPLDGAGITTWAARDNEAKLVTDTSQEPHFVESPGGPTGSELVVVLRDEHGEPLGVLNVEHRRPHGLTEEDRQLLLALADLVMIAFRHATYRQELSRAKSELANVEALAWRGLFGSNWWHSAAQESGVIKWTVRRLRRKVSAEAQPLLDQINEAARKIEAMPKFSW
ncbi:MAG: GAF domain-containing protein, partial [Anaerolineales bacterium]|nr:GAF domain-containing protein [Anaerolineales bacterium]